MRDGHHDSSSSLPVEDVVVESTANNDTSHDSTQEQTDHKMEASLSTEKTLSPQKTGLTEEIVIDEDPTETPTETAPLQVELTSTDNLQDNTNKDDVPVVTPKDLPWWFPRWRGRPIFYGIPEALGWACSCVGQAAILIGIGAFISPALVNLAKLEAGCEIEAPPEYAEDETYVLPECTGTVHGIKPSSLLTIMSSIVGISSAFIIPIMGAVVDYTDKRRYLGRWISVFYSGGILTLAFLNEDSWFALSIVLLVAVSIGWAQNMLFYAYLPELTDNESRLNEFSKSFTVLIFTTMVLYLAVVVAISVALGFADVDAAVARCSAVVAFVLSATLFYLSWGLLFQPRPAAHQLAPGQSLLSAGFHQVYRTTIKIYNDYQALKWFYISICFGDAAIQSLSVIAITFITDQLELNSQEVASAALLMLLGSIPGALAGAWVNRKFNPVRSSSLAVFGMIIGTSCASIILKGPGQQIITYVFAALWGVGTGWYGISVLASFCKLPFCIEIAVLLIHHPPFVYF